MNAIASKIEVGRRVRYFAGYGNIDGTGRIVAVHGTPNPAERQTYLRGLVQVIQGADCTVDVVLDDGRKLTGIRQCGIDSIGIGIKLAEGVEGRASIEAAEQAAAKFSADAQLAKLKARHDFEQAEAGRDIPAADRPIFYWNGIKDAKGEKLQTCHYSDGELLSYPPGTLTIYARNYQRFSAKVRACFAVQNDTDSQVDYFDNDRIRVIPAHPLYALVKAALDASNAHNAKRAAKRAGGAK